MGNIIIAIVALVVGVAVGIILTKTLLKNSALKQSEQMLKEAQEQAELLKKEKNVRGN